MPPRVRLLVLDGDHTLWQPLDGICCSERTQNDPTGAPAFAFTQDPADLDRAVRADGVRFALAPGARALLTRLPAAGIGLALASWNHPAPIRALLDAFGLLPLFGTVVAAWSSDKAAMLRTILAAEAAAGRPVDPAVVLFVDDDPAGAYRAMAAAVGVQFAQMGNPAEARSFAGIARRLGLPSA